MACGCVLFSRLVCRDILATAICVCVCVRWCERHSKSVSLHGRASSRLARARATPPLGAGPPKPVLSAIPTARDPWYFPRSKSATHPRTRNGLFVVTSFMEETQSGNPRFCSRPGRKETQFCFRAHAKKKKSTKTPPQKHKNIPPKAQKHPPKGGGTPQKNHTAALTREIKPLASKNNSHPPPRRGE